MKVANRKLRDTTVLSGLLLLAGALPLAAEMVPNRLTEAERCSGWHLLFDGATLAGFKGYRSDTPGKGWQVQDGMIVRTAPAGDLLTTETFDSFELQLEYRISPGGNSGLMFHVTEDDKHPWQTGPEVQILDNGTGKDPQQAGWLYQLYQPTPPTWVARLEQAAGLPVAEVVDSTRPAGEWNHLYLRVASGSGEVCVNGVSYYKFAIGSDEWNERVAASKFVKYPRFGRTGQGHICLQDHGDAVAFRSLKVRRLPQGKLPKEPHDGMLPVAAVPAFPEIEWEGWSAESDDGKPVPPLRPLLLTHAGDGSGRRFVLEQSGMIHVMDPEGQRATLFLDLREATRFWKYRNEEGLLGLAFHPRFGETGEFFVCYSPVANPGVERISRFKVSAVDPNRADPASEAVVLEFDQPFPNHNGGSIAFGPDGYLYVGLGDGGSRNDPFDNAQDLSSLLGKVLRLDVDQIENDQGYAVPSDNPFVDRAGVRPEIWALGFRNPWQLSFDQQTGQLWLADVGQDLQEEINIVEKGGNYGWRRREGSHPFGSVRETAPMIDPVWEYDHQVGKSITGGCVVSGGSITELEGRYLYGDHVTGRLWALAVQGVAGAGVPVVSNPGIAWNGLPIFGFGLDEAGTAYVLTASPVGQGIFKLVRQAQ